MRGILNLRSSAECPQRPFPPSRRCGPLPREDGAGIRGVQGALGERGGRHDEAHGKESGEPKLSVLTIGYFP